MALTRTARRTRLIWFCFSSDSRSPRLSLSIPHLCPLMSSSLPLRHRSDSRPTVPAASPHRVVSPPPTPLETAVKYFEGLDEPFSHPILDMSASPSPSGDRPTNSPSAVERMCSCSSGRNGTRPSGSTTSTAQTSALGSAT